MNQDIIQDAITKFNAKDHSLLQNSNYLLPELESLQHTSNQSPFESIFQNLNPSLTIHEAADLLGYCERDIPFSIPKYLEVLAYFRKIESLIRFSFWTVDNPGPHHFSKLLYTKKIKDSFPPNLILCIFAIFADPKGLNLRNITIHGFDYDISLSLPLLTNIYQKINLLIPHHNYNPESFSFESENQQFEFFKARLNIPDTLLGFDYVIQTRFPVLDERRIAVLKTAYDLFYSGNYEDSLLLLFPLFEHSLRRAGCCIQNLPIDKLCASSEEHFLSIQEVCEFLPPPLSNFILDLLFAPNGPRIRDRLMHGALTKFPKTFSYLLFVLFERCSQYFKDGLLIPYSMAFHPVRCFEYEFFKCLSPFFPNSATIPFEMLDIYDPSSCLYLKECISAVSSLKAPNLSQNEKSNDWDYLFNGFYQQFICGSALLLMSKKPKESTIKHLASLSYNSVKFQKSGDKVRFQKLILDKCKILKKYLPFLNDVSNFDQFLSLITSSDFLRDQIFPVLSPNPT